MSETIQFLCYFFFDDLRHFLALCLVLLLSVPHKFIEMNAYGQEKDVNNDNAGNGGK